MSWLQRLSETYDLCAGAPQFVTKPLPPIGYTPQQAHIEIVLDGSGVFQRARVVRKEETPIPATEQSAGRTGTKAPPHPLCDKLQYLARDYAERGGTKASFFYEFLEQLRSWCDSPYGHPKVRAVLAYVEHGTMIEDLVRYLVLATDANGKLRSKTPGDTADIFKVLPPGTDQGSAFVRWRVEITGDPESAVWRDPGIQHCWNLFELSRMKKLGLCMVTGKEGVPLASVHPRRLRHPADGAKLISSNDKSGFTFRGRFTDDTGDQACGIGYETSQKAHLALRWLIERQRVRTSDHQVIVAWSLCGADIPDPLADSFDILDSQADRSLSRYGGDVGQAFALALRKRIAGYEACLDAASCIIVLGINAATPGRMSLTYFSELTWKEFLQHVEAWHLRYAWHQDYGDERKFVGAPSLRDIAEAAYGKRMDAHLLDLCLERLLPCVLEGGSIPRDVFQATLRRVVRRSGLPIIEWEKALGIACALYNGENQRTTGGTNTMALDPNCIARDYLFGRLLAYAEHVEKRAMTYSDEQRETHASKLMHRFAERPCQTWRQIELSLAPSRSRLAARSPGYFHQLERQIDQIVSLFKSEEFIDDRKLTGEFLLGYHCQRAEFARQRFEYKPNEPKDGSGNQENNDDSSA